jgi:hypothetical protein
MGCPPLPAGTHDWSETMLRPSVRAGRPFHLITKAGTKIFFQGVTRDVPRKAFVSHFVIFVASWFLFFSDVR